MASCISHTDCRDLLEKTDLRRRPKRKEQIKTRPQNFQLKEKTEKLSSNSLLQICRESQGGLQAVSSAHLLFPQNEQDVHTHDRPKTSGMELSYLLLIL